MMEAVVNSGTGYPVGRADLPLRLRVRPAPPTTPGSPDTRRTCSASCGSVTTITPTSSSRGGAAAAPIWAEFMKRAIKLPQYADTKDSRRPREWCRSTRQSDEPAGHSVLPADLYGRIHRRDGAEGDLRPGLRRPPQHLLEDPRIGNARCGSSSANDERNGTGHLRRHPRGTGSSPASP